MAEFDFEQFGREILAGVSGAANTVADAARSVGDDAGRYKAFYQTGRYLDNHDLVSANGGNLSISDGKSIWITRTGAMLGTLVPGEIISCSLSQATTDIRASRELPVHRAMMQAAFNLLAVPQDSGGATTDQGIPIADAQAQNKNVEKVAFAIVHAHPLAATTLSLVADSINPLDSEGSLILGGSVPVLAPAQTIASEEAAEMLAAMVAAGGKCAMIRGHGSFALAATLAEALELTVCLERSARIILLAR